MRLFQGRGLVATASCFSKGAGTWHRSRSYLDRRMRVLEKGFCMSQSLDNGVQHKACESLRKEERQPPALKGRGHVAPVQVVPGQGDSIFRVRKGFGS